MTELRKATLNGMDCKGIAKEFTDKDNKMWKARIEMTKDKFQEEKKYWYKGFVETNDGLKKIEGVMFGWWPINHGNFITVDLQTTIEPTIKEIEQSQ